MQCDFDMNTPLKLLLFGAKRLYIPSSFAIAVKTNNAVDSRAYLESTTTGDPAWTIGRYSLATCKQDLVICNQMK